MNPAKQYLKSIGIFATDFAKKIKKGDMVVSRMVNGKWPSEREKEKFKAVHKASKGELTPNILCEIEEYTPSRGPDSNNVRK